MEVLTTPKSTEKKPWSMNQFSGGPSQPSIVAEPDNVDRPMFVHPAETPQNGPLAERLKTY